MSELHEEAKNLIYSKYNILLDLDCRSFDLNFDLLSDILDKINKERFDPNERFMFVHMDTDYYDNLIPFGLLVINLIRLFKIKKIPLYTILFVTNHYGIQREFDNLLLDHSTKDRPTVIETILSHVYLSKDISTEFDIDVDKIEKQGLCMMGVRRAHRTAMVNFLKNENLLDKVALQTNFK